MIDSILNRFGKRDFELSYYPHTSISLVDFLALATPHV